MLKWWNRYTRWSQKPMPKGMRVQVSPSVPKISGYSSVAERRPSKSNVVSSNLATRSKYFILKYIMANFTFRYSKPNHGYEHAVVVEEIIRFSKSADGELTMMHLRNGETLISDDSLNTLEARYNSCMDSTRN